MGARDGVVLMRVCSNVDCVFWILSENKKVRHPDDEGVPQVGF